MYFYNIKKTQRKKNKINTLSSCLSYLRLLKFHLNSNKCKLIMHSVLTCKMQKNWESRDTAYLVHWPPRLFQSSTVCVHLAFSCVFVSLFCFRFSSLPLLCSVFFFLFFHNDERMKERNPSDPLLSALFFPLAVFSFFFLLSVVCLSLVSLLSFLPRSVTV